jgi:hypothetical protein
MLPGSFWCYSLRTLHDLLMAVETGLAWESEKRNQNGRLNTWQWRGGHYLVESCLLKRFDSVFFSKYVCIFFTLINFSSPKFSLKSTLDWILRCECCPAPFFFSSFYYNNDSTSHVEEENKSLNWLQGRIYILQLSDLFLNGQGPIWSKKKKFSYSLLVYLKSVP